MPQNRVLPAVLALSASGLVGIAVYEGYRPKAYDDGVGVQTVGFGSTTHADGTPVRRGDSTTPERALVRLAQDAASKERALRACIGPVPLYQWEWDAYVSLAYNIGATAFCRSSIVRHLRATPPDYAAACKSILLWDKAGGKTLPGLTRRRQAEYQRCIGAAPEGAP
jgi:lysozyme